MKGESKPNNTEKGTRGKQPQKRIPEEESTAEGTIEAMRRWMVIDKKVRAEEASLAQ